MCVLSCHVHQFHASEEARNGAPFQFCFPHFNCSRFSRHDPDRGRFLSSVPGRPNPARFRCLLISWSKVVGAFQSSAGIVSHISGRLSSVFRHEFFARLPWRVTAPQKQCSPRFRSRRSERADDSFSFMSVDSSSIAQLVRFVKPFSQEFFSLRSTPAIPHPLFIHSPCFSKSGFSITLIISVVCFSSGSIAYFPQAVKGVSPHFWRRVQNLLVRHAVLCTASPLLHALPDLARS